MRKKSLTCLLAVSLVAVSLTACAGKGGESAADMGSAGQTSEELQTQGETDSNSQDDAEPKSSFETGLEFFYGIEGTKDDTKALEIFQSEAGAGNADANYYVGIINDHKYAFDAEVENYKAGDANGSALCSYALGDCYYEGMTVEYDFGKAKEYYDKAINAGLVEANYGLGKLALNGCGEAVDVNKAVTCFEKAITGSEPGIVADAYEKLGEIYSNEAYGLGVDYNKAIEYYTKANDLTQGCNGSYMRSIALCYQKLGDAGSEKEWNKKALDKYKELAEGGTPYGMYYYASYCEDGIGMDEPDYLTAWEWYNKASEAGYADATTKIGDIFAEKKYAFWDAAGIEPGSGDMLDTTAYEWYQKAAYAHSTTAMVNLAKWCKAGDGLRIDFETAIRYLENAAYYGDSKGYYTIGRMYYYGIKDILEFDGDKAAEYLTKAAEAGSFDAYHVLAGGYKNSDPARSIEYLEEGASRRNTTCMRRLGDYYKDGIGVEADIDTAVFWYEKAAKAGDAQGYNDIAYLYIVGEAVPLDYSKAMEYYRKSVDELGYGSNAELIGWWYHQGERVEKDDDEALKWFLKAGELGWGYGYEDAASLYTYEEFGRDYVKAFECFEKAAYLGCSNSMYYTGRNYFYGDGTEVNDQLAYRWLKRAKENGCSKEDLNQLLSTVEGRL